MPRYYEVPPSDEEEEDRRSGSSSSSSSRGEGEGGRAVAGGARIHYWKSVLVCVFFYFMLSCGIERIYQPMVCVCLFIYYELYYVCVEHLCLCSYT